MKKFYDYLFDLVAFVASTTVFSIVYFGIGILLFCEIFYDFSGFIAAVLYLLLFGIGITGYVIVEKYVFYRKYSKKKARLLCFELDKVYTADKEVVINYDDIDRILSIGPKGYDFFEVVIISKFDDVIVFLNFRALEYLLKIPNANLQSKLSMCSYDYMGPNGQYCIKKGSKEFNKTDYNRKYFY